MMIDHRKAINDYTQVVLVNDRGDTVKSFIREDFSFDLTSRYGSVVDDERLSALGDFWNAGTAAINAVTGTKVAQRQAKSLMMSIATWNGTDKPSFSLNLLFVAINSSVDVLGEVMKLMKGVVPTKETIIDLVAPLSYAPIEMAGAEGTWTVAIGQWFYAPYQIITSMAPRISKEVVAGGKPLYAEVNIRFEPYRMVDYEEFKQYFKAPAQDAAGNVQPIKLGELTADQIPGIKEIRDLLRGGEK